MTIPLRERLRLVLGKTLTEDEVLGRFQFGELLGTGATCKVYAALDATTNAKVAIKVFDKAKLIELRQSIAVRAHKELAVHRVCRRLRKIISEIEILRAIDHPNIIKFFGAYETSHRICIVFEHVKGADLLDYLTKKGRLCEAKATFVFQQIFSAVRYCHERNIYHRDLKLENVLVRSDLHVKVIDFGLAERRHGLLDTVCGTPLYSSPEVLFSDSQFECSGRFQGAPADVWSVGVMLFALLTGCAPFDDSTFETLRYDVSRNRITYPAHISDAAKGLLKTMLTFDPQVRPSITDILDYKWLNPEDVLTAREYTAIDTSPVNAFVRITHQKHIQSHEGSDKTICSSASSDELAI
uniref:Protein kinase putative n=1 Tax=Albugo laibachii Nc14 TaxID=890382 RepID=F0W4M7_9STRA|nr:protein kinase putative [Albugo laibachii Nc14]|eukprot:CCA16061.1 protein kinase putative [Albugo laibachii Nc14]